MTDAPGLPTISESPNENRIRLTKRKLDDAFHILDSAVSINDNSSDRPPPPKRSNTIKSLYSTLAKYGIKSKEPSSTSASPLPKNTPHLTAILSRAASKTKSSFSFKSSLHSPSPAPLLPATAEYRPSSLPSFLTRLSTYKLSTYANKPPAIDAVAASKCGWINNGKDRLVCGLCNASWVAVGRDGLGRDAANTLIAKQRASLVESHKNGCPWKTRQCDDAIYCIPLQSPGVMIREIKGRASIMDPFIKDFLIKHPLTATQLNAFRSTIASYMPPDPPSSTTDESNSQLPTSPPSETALLAALFGWSLVPLSSTTQRPTTVPPSPPFSRASSIAPPQTPQKSTAGPSNTAIISSSSRSTPQQRLLPNTEFTFRLPSDVTDKPENALLQCTLCQRRIGLWSFTTTSTTLTRPELSASASASNVTAAVNEEPKDTPMTPSTNENDSQSSAGLSRSNTMQSTPSRPKKSLPHRSFDLLKEHRSYCPYAVRSTTVPSFPLPSQQQQLPTSPVNPPITPSRSSSSSLFTKTLQRNGSTASLANGNSVHALAGSGGGGGIPGAMEGWRAVLTVVLRYGMAKKQRIEYSFFASRENSQSEQGAEGMRDDPDAMDVDTVKAMVNGVKNRGGKDLLKYVKGLLG